LVCNPTKAANEVEGGGVFSNLGNSIAWWLGILLLNILPLCPLKLPLHLFVVEQGWQIVVFRVSANVTINKR
jgi:hypothetical protein